MPKSFAEVNAEIIAGLDIQAEYAAMGVVFNGRPRASGKISCHAIGREDRTASAWVDLKTGRYGDSGDIAGHSLSLWDFAALHGNQGTWQAARAHFARKAGVKVGKSNPPDKWRDRLEFQSWDTPGNLVLAQRWCLQAKPGVTVDAILAAGGRMAYYPCFRDEKTGELKRHYNHVQVIALPAYGPSLLQDDPVAWVIWDCTGADLATKRKGMPSVYSKMLSIGPTAGAMMGLHGLLRLTDEERRPSIAAAWKTGGPTDMLALWSAIPPELRDTDVVVTNAGSETADCTIANAKLFAGVRTVVVHDADEAGEAGKAKWINQLRGVASETYQVTLPYEIAPKGGKDVRDFLREGNSYESLKDLAELVPAAAPSDGKESSPAGHPVADRAAIILKAIQLEVLGEYEDGTIKLYSTHTRRTCLVPNKSLPPISKFTLAHFVQICGPPAKASLLESADNQELIGGDMYTVSEARMAIHESIASVGRLEDDTEIGPGIWQSRESDGSEYDAVVLVGSNQAAEYNGSLVRIDHPRSRGLVLDFAQSAKQWYEFDTLAANLKRCEDLKFRQDTFWECVSLWERWRWRTKNSPFTVTGLVLATWVQSLWHWRPQVAVLGASKSGKSFFCEALAGIFHGLVIKTANTTEAGLRQRIKNALPAVIVDEVDADERDKAREQLKILKTLRAASRGDEALRGTSGRQSGTSFVLRHLVWLCGIHLAYSRAADQNRAVMLELLAPEKHMEGKLTLPSESALRDLGQRLMSVAVWSVREARIIAARIKDMRFEGVDSRIVESYAVPIAMANVALGYSEEKTRVVLEEILKSTQGDATPTTSDEQTLVADILSSHLRIRGEANSVSYLIDVVIRGLAGAGDARIALASNGVAFEFEGDGTRVTSLLLAHRAVTKHLLFGTRWEGQSIEQVLRRIPGAVLSRRRFNSQRSYCVSIPWEWLKRESFGDDEHEEQKPASENANF